MATIVRLATVADLPRLREFEQGVIDAERPYQPYLKDDPVHYYDLDHMIDANDVCLVVAEVDGHLVGSGYARVEESKPYIRYHQFGYLGFMFVVPQFRGQGVIQDIMAYLERWCLERGVGVLHLEVFADNARASRAYDKAGFAANLIDMRKVIAPIQ